jgi:hypothetical protein
LINQLTKFEKKNMKKILASVFAFAFALGLSQAQDTDQPAVLKSKRGYNILPEAGEWGLGVSANPFFRYLGNVLNGNTFNTEPAFTYTTNPSNNIALFGKYVVDANTQYRVRFNINIGTNIDKGVVRQDELTPDLLYPNFTEDWRKTNFNTIVLAAGYEKRRGTTKLQGVYGGELVVGYSSTKQTYQYGNSINLDFNRPQTASFGDNIITGTPLGSNNFLADVRKTEQQNAPSFLVGARGFIGVEYFFAPKMSVGGEFGYMLAFRNTGRVNFITEQWDGNTDTVVTTKIDQLGNNGLTSIGLGLDNLSGSINLLFYF